MHIAERFRPAHTDDVFHFINTHRFGTLVTHTAGGFDATPLPWVAEREQGQLILWAHLASANLQLQQVHGNVLIVFTGVNGYISPRILPTPHSAPTWNYIAVHAQGRCEVLNETNTELAVEKLVMAMENGRTSPWSTVEMGPRREKLMRHVTGVRVVVDTVEAKFKLGQNESDVDLRAIMESLDDDYRDHGDHGDLADAMRRANPERDV